MTFTTHLLSSRSSSILVAISANMCSVPTPRTPPYWLSDTPISSWSKSSMKVSASFEYILVQLIPRHWSKSVAALFFGMVVTSSLFQILGHPLPSNTQFMILVKTGPRLAAVLVTMLAGRSIDTCDLGFFKAISLSTTTFSSSTGTSRS